jgi:hypothetical protein
MDDPLVAMAIPPLVAILLNREKAKGSALTQDEVQTLRDTATCVMVPASIRKAMEEKRGYPDIDLDNAWEEWLSFRKELSQTD